MERTVEVIGFTGLLVNAGHSLSNDRSSSLSGLNESLTNHQCRHAASVGWLITNLTAAEGAFFGKSSRNNHDAALSFGKCKFKSIYSASADSTTALCLFEYLYLFHTLVRTNLKQILNADHYKEMTHLRMILWASNPVTPASSLYHNDGLEKLQTGPEWRISSRPAASQATLKLQKSRWD